jgi:hypothetical protein
MFSTSDGRAPPRSYEGVSDIVGRAKALDEQRILVLTIMT